MMDLPTAATVYVPREGSHLHAILAPGTGIVGSNAAEWLGGDSDGDDGKVMLDYQPVSQAVNITTFADRCYHAFDRHVRHYPTHQRLLADAEQLWPVAFYWRPEGRVEVSGAGAGLRSVLPDGQALYKLAEWLGLPRDEAAWAGPTNDALTRELRATHRVTA
jgi:hypothetical protein